MDLRSLTILTAAALALSLAGCAGSSPDYIDQAKADGLAVTDPVGVNYSVNRICQNMDEGARVPADVLVSMPPADNPGQALHLVKLGVAERCPQHNQVYANVLQVFDDISATVEEVEREYVHSDPDFNVGPGGYCTASPCGSNGRVPEVDGQPYSP